MIKDSTILQYVYVPSNLNSPETFSLAHYGTPQNPILRNPPFEMILLLRSGESMIITDEFCTVANAPHLIIYNPNCRHAEFNKSAVPYEKYMIRFRDLSSPGLLPLYHQIIRSSNQSFYQVALTEKQINWLYQICDHMMDLMLKEKIPHTDERVLNPFRYLLTEILYILQKSPAEETSEATPHIMQVLSYIAEHLTEKITLDDIADYAHIGKTKLCTDFKKYFSMTVHQYILRQRLILSRQYLDQGYSVNEAAELCGFTDSAHFIRAFKNYFSITPLQHRRASKETKA